MRIAAALTLLLGLAVATALVAYQGFGAVARELASGVAAVVPIVIGQVAQTAVAGCAWRILLGEMGRGRTRALIAYRWVRNSVNTLLPVGRVGGDVVGARLLVLNGTRADLAAASVLADKTIEVCAILLFAWIGLLLGYSLGLKGEVMSWTAVGLAVFSIMIIAFVIGQRMGLVRMAEHILLKVADLLKERQVGRPGTTQTILLAIYRHRSRVLAAFAIHVFGWTLSAFAIWGALDVMGHPLSLGEAFVLEGLAQAIAAAAFLMPAALGVQEAGYMMVAALLGLPPQVGLALSLLRRLSDLVIGVPGLVAWQVLEGKRLWASWSGKGGWRRRQGEVSNSGP